MTQALKHSKELMLPQELETFYILPTLRHMLADELKKSGKKQTEIANLFGVTPATISQYHTKKRGSEIILPAIVQEYIIQAASKIKDRYTYIKEIQNLLKIIRNTKTLCQIHHQLNDLPLNCHPEKIGCHVNPV